MSEQKTGITYQEYMASAASGWEKYMKDGVLIPDFRIPPEVFSSWERCRANGVDPEKMERRILSSNALRYRLNELKEVIEIAGPICMEVAEANPSLDMCFDLYDSDMYLLKHFTDESNTERGSAVKMFPIGMNFSESFGTNAVNLARLFEAPMQVRGPEHYCRELHGITSTAIIIRDRNAEVVALLGVNTTAGERCEEIINLLVAIRRTIKYRLNEKIVIRPDVVSMEILENIPKPAVIVGGGGNILMENDLAKTILNGNMESIIGLSIDAAWGSRNPFKEVMFTKKPLVNKDFVCRVNDRILRLHGAVKPIFSEGKKLMAMIGIFDDPATVKTGMKKSGDKKLFNFDDIVGTSDEIQQVIRLARETSRMNSNVLLQGETGTGKELFAQAIHQESMYSDGPFVAVNCAAIPENLLESELFGYEGGAFTGAKKEGKMGKFEIARGGTLFLDEVNSMPYSMQTKLLRVLQNKSITRVGSNEEIPINARIITASNEDLRKLVQEGDFRGDLYYRINVIIITIPPLRARTGDIPVISDYFMKKMTKELNAPFTMDESAQEMLERYDWPGNVRELENVIERSCVMASARKQYALKAEDIFIDSGYENQISKEPEPQTAEPSEELQGLEKLEAEEIRRVVEKNKGNIQKSAKELGMARNTLYRRMEKYGLR